MNVSICFVSRRTSLCSSIIFSCAAFSCLSFRCDASAVSPICKSQLRLRQRFRKHSRHAHLKSANCFCVFLFIQELKKTRSLYKEVTLTKKVSHISFLCHFVGIEMGSNLVFNFPHIISFLLFDITLQLRVNKKTTLTNKKTACSYVMRVRN